MTRANVTIRTATPADAPAIAAILRTLGWFERINEEPAEETERLLVTSLKRSDERNTVLVAEDCASKVVAGYSAVHWFPTLLRGEEGFVSELFVHPSYSGQGIGSALLDAVTAEARARECTRLELINMRFRESYQRGFYAKHGWEERPDAAQFVLFPSER